MNNEVIISCAVTGSGDTVGKHPAIPVTPEEIANAAIEAARAGSHGRGFAVVADEVSTLAENSKKAAREIGGLIQESNRKSQEGGQLAALGVKALEEILERNIQFSEFISEIEASSSEQTDRIQEIDTLTQEIKTSSSQQALSVEQVLRAVDEMNHSIQ